MPQNEKTKQEKDKKPTKGRTATGQAVSFITGGFLGLGVYNIYHAVKDKPEEPSSPKP